MKPFFPLPAMFLLLLACQQPEDPQPTTITYSLQEQQFIQALEEHISPLSSQMAVLDLPDSELRFLDTLAKAKIVGMGEATHGTHEFFAMKDRMFRYLATYHGFRVFAFEMDFAESLYFNDYITHKINDIDLRQLMREKMLFWTWNNEEVATLIEWMRAFNEGKPAAEMVHLWGVDCQFAHYQVRQLTARLPDEAMATQLKAWLEPFEHTDLEQVLASYGFEAIEQQCIQASTYLQKHQTMLEETVGALEYAHMLQLVESLRHTYKVAHESNNSVFHLRDEYMAHNTQWAQQVLGPETHIALWAHNFHVSTPFTTGITYTQGGFLRQAMGYDYRIIGFSFTKGSFLAVHPHLGLRTQHINTLPLLRSANYYFTGASHSRFILPLAQLQATDEWHAYLSKGRWLRSFGALFDGNASGADTHEVIHPSTYDLLIYFNEAKAADRL